MLVENPAIQTLVFQADTLVLEMLVDNIQLHEKAIAHELAASWVELAGNELAAA